MTDSPRPPAPATASHAAVALMFLMSGAAGLTYEVVWSRQLTTFFGSTLFGVATVLSAFMGGLALGSWLLGGRADRMRRPLYVYGLFEIAIGVAAVAFPFLLKATQPILGAFYATGGEGTFYLFSLVRFVLTFALLMVPTTLMGATLPIMSKAVTRSFENVGRRVGGLYALNTAGAVLGTFVTGFFLLEHFGVFGTTLLACAVNITVGVLAIMIGRTSFLVEPVQEARLPALRSTHTEFLTPLQLRIVLFSYFLSGLVALSYQVAWTRALIFGFSHLKSTTYSFSGMLVIFLMGLAIGSALMQAIVDRQKHLLRLYGLVQAGIGLSAALSYFMIVRDLPALQELRDDNTLIWANSVLNVMIRTAAAIGIPTFLMGAAFPIVARLVVGSVERVGGDIARVYALNTLGAIIGSFLSGFVFIPLIGITNTIAMLASVNLLVAAAIFAVNRAEEAKHRHGMTAFAVVAAIVIAVRIGASATHLQRLQDNEEMVFYKEGALATVSVIENNAGDRTIYVDGVGVAGTDKVLLTDQKSLAHMPMILLGGRAGRTLSVGFGSGGASYSYTLYDDIESINTIEIAPEVIRAAPTLLASNYGIIMPEDDITGATEEQIPGTRNPVSEFEHTPLPGYRSFDERFKVLIDDARSYLRFTDATYDVIATDCTDLRYKSNANLYDLEYFTLCRERISDRGLVVVWMPLAGLSDRAFSCALRTFQVVFPEMSVWYFTNYPTHYCLLIGGKGPLQIDYDDVLRAMSLPGVKQDLDEIGLNDPDKLLASFVADDRSLTEILKDYPLNTEDHPLIEFEAPRYGYDSRPVYDNLIRLYNQQNDVLTQVTNAPPEAAARISRMIEANPVIFRGHHEYRQFNFVEACERYLEAQKMTPSDTSIDDLLEFDEVLRHVESRWEDPSLNTLWLGHALVRIYLMQDRFADAVRVGAHFTRFQPNTSDPVLSKGHNQALGALNMAVAEAYLRSGNEMRARQYHEIAATTETWAEFRARIIGG